MSSRAYDASNFTTVLKPVLVEGREGRMDTTVSSVPSDHALASAGANFDLSHGTFNGPVFNNAVFHDAVTITKGLVAPAPGKTALEQALEALRSALAALPEAKRTDAKLTAVLVLVSVLVSIVFR